MSELDACVMAVAAVDSGAVIAVRESLAQRADEIVTAIGLSVSTASTADDKRAALTGWESNSAAMTALRQAGKSGALAPFRSQIIQTAQIENQARLQAQREAERQASLDRIAPTTSPSARLQAERISRSVVIVFNMTDNSSGSGFIVAPEVVVTNLHVVQPEGGNLFIVNDGKTLQSRLSAQILFRSATHDIAILKVPGLRGQVVELAGPEPSRGGDVWAYGFPGVADRSRRADSETEWIATLTRGIVSRVYSDYTLQSGRRGPQSRILQHDANIFPGNSGGPLFDSCHRVIGVNTQLSSERSFTVFYSVSATVLPDLLRQANVTPRISNSRC